MFHFPSLSNRVLAVMALLALAMVPVTVWGGAQEDQKKLLKAAQKEVKSRPLSVVA